MRYTRKITALLLALLMTLTLLSGCGSEEKLTVSALLPWVPETLDPAMVTNDAEKIVVSHLYENLMKLTSNSDGTVSETYAAAKSSQCTDNDDGTQTYTFTLRDDMVWSDGQPVTAGDFVYAWRHLVDPDTKSPNAALLNMVSGYQAARNGQEKKLAVSAPDEYTLQVELAHPCPYFLRAICTAAATMPVRKDDLTLTNGAYRITEQTADSLTAVATVEKNSGPDTLHFGFCATAEEAERLFAGGAWDVVLGLTKASGSTVVTEPYPQVGTLLVNQMAEHMTGKGSKSLRQAMALVIDRNAVAELLGEGFTPAEGLVPPGIVNTQGQDYRTDCGPVTDNVPEDYEKNCETARELLEKAGFDAQTLKKLKNMSLVYEDTPAMQGVAQLLQSAWMTQLGISVTPQAVSAEELASELRKGEFTMALTTVRADRADAAGYLDIFRSGRSNNWANLHSGAYDTLMRVVDASQTAEGRDAFMKDAEGLLLDNSYVMPLYFTTHCRQVNGNLGGLYHDGLGVYYLWNMHKAG